MQKICTECNYVGNEIRSKYLFIILPLIILYMGSQFLLGFFTNLDYYMGFIDQSFLIVVAGFILIGVGLYSLILFLRSSYECPNCKKKRTMIPLDTPRAQALIKEHNLTVPTSALPETNPNLE